MCFLTTRATPLIAPRSRPPKSTAQSAQAKGGGLPVWRAARHCLARRAPRGGGSGNRRGDSAVKWLLRAASRCFAEPSEPRALAVSRRVALCSVAGVCQSQWSSLFEVTWMGLGLREAFLRDSSVSLAVWSAQSCCLPHLDREAWPSDTPPALAHSSYTAAQVLLIFTPSRTASGPDRAGPGLQRACSGPASPPKPRSACHNFGRDRPALLS